MRKSMKKRFTYFGVILQITLMISMSFAIALLLNDDFVSAAGVAIPISTKVPPVTNIPTATSGATVSAAQIVPTSNVINLQPLSLSGYSGTASAAQFAQQAQVTYLGANQYQVTYSLGLSGTTETSIVTAQQLAQAGLSVPSGYAIEGYTGVKLPVVGTVLQNSPLLGHLVTGLVWAGLVVGVIQLLGGFGLSPQTTKSLSLAAFGGIVAGQATYGAFQQFSSVKYFLANKVGITYGSAIIGVAVAVAIFIATYSSESKKMVNFQCLPYEPPLGGSQCEQCNKNPFRPCSEYRCRSLGQACTLLNSGTSEEQCAWVSPNDVTSPTIAPWNNALSPSGLKYQQDTAIRPPAIGTKIVTSAGGCLPAFTPLQFGITTNEPAQCKIDYNHTLKYDDMQYYFGGSNYYEYNHTEIMRLPGPDTGNNSIAPLLQNNGQFSLYVRCRDANGNANDDEYAFSFCVEQGPDTTPPIIEGFSIPSGSYVGFNQSSVSIEAYTNEPSECRWSTDSKTYEDMENAMQCSTQSYQVNANLQYTCLGNVTGIQNRQDNTFYFRCKDQPGKPDNERNVNVQSVPLVLKGSQPLIIVSTAPNGTISGSTDNVAVNLQLETSAGASNGNATCLFSATGQNDSYVTMFSTSSYAHSQSLNLISGAYTYYFKCIDAGGNTAESSTSFTVLVDKQAPMVTRVYKQDALKIVTDESAQCSYSLASCNFNIDDGTKMIYSNPSIKNNLYAEWKPSSTYYIRCRDLYGNEPAPNQCSIVASPAMISTAK